MQILTIYMFNKEYICLVKEEFYFIKMHGTTIKIIILCFRLCMSEIHLEKKHTQRL